MEFRGQQLGRSVVCSLVLAAVGLLMAGCGGTKAKTGVKSGDSGDIELKVSKVEPKPAATAKDALRNLLYAFADGDEPAAQATLKTDDADSRRMIVAVCLAVDKMKQFQTRLTEKYGKDAWEKFNSMESGGATLTLAGRAGYDKLLASVSEPTGDELRAKIAGFNAPVRVVRGKDGWLVDASSLFQGPVSLDKMLKQQVAIIKVVEEYSRKIPETKMSLAELDKKMGEDILGRLLAAGAEAKFSGK